MYITSILSVFLIFCSLLIYFFIIICDIFDLPAFCSIAFTVLLLAADSILFPQVILKILKKALSKDGVPDVLSKIFPQNKSILFILDTPYPAAFHIFPIFSNPVFIFSRGLCSLLTPSQLEWTAEREKKKAEGRSNRLFMAAGFIPFFLFHLASLMRRLGLRNRTYGGSRSILSFSGGVFVFVKFLYASLYLASREINSYFDSLQKNSEKYLPEILKVIDSFDRETVDTEIKTFMRSVDFLCFSEQTGETSLISPDSYRTLWKNWLLMFHSHIPSCIRSSSGIFLIQDRSDVKNYRLILAIAASLILASALMPLGINTGIAIIVAAVLLFVLHFRQRPFGSKKSAEDPALLRYSPIAGSQTVLRGTIITRDDMLFLKTDKFEYQLYFYDFVPSDFWEYENMEVDIAGWLKRSERTYLEVMAMKKDGKKVYSSDHAFYYLFADALLLIAGILMTVSLFKAV